MLEYCKRSENRIRAARIRGCERRFPLVRAVVRAGARRPVQPDGEFLRPLQSCDTRRTGRELQNFYVELIGEAEK
jgi:hypothetical protein